jgi:urea transporter/murein DD-endopeptidase MepM/ murein hydrolase activator NlpD
VLFFSNNKLFAILLLVVSFFNPYAGVSGLTAVLVSIGLGYFTGLNKVFLERGTYSYNALIIGLGMGTFYNLNLAFFTLLTVMAIFSVVLSVVFQNKLGKTSLPFLTLPFVICFWIVLLVTKSIEAIPFTQRNIYWINNVYEVGNSGMVQFLLYFDRLEMPFLVSTFFRALSSLYFQNNILSGIIIAIGMLIHSRIIFTLLIVGFLAAFGFNYIVLAHPTDVSYYLLGDNYILVTVAIGGFFAIPSKHSYLWAMISVPITFVIVVALSKLLESSGLPVFSMPFCITVLCMLMFFQLKSQLGRLVLTPIQLYSPEKNLYNYLNNKERLQNTNHIRLQLPFLGKWFVSQGYDGIQTHKGDWSKALDFIIVDNELKTYKNYAQQVEDFYCYNKPVLAPADGYVMHIEDGIDDNAITKINQEKNWGNSIVIKHAEGLYTKISHIKKLSFKVAIGEYVKQGDVIASCGNSGRSPEPHLHFQVQTTSFIGSKTFAYPLSYYVTESNGVSTIKEFTIPSETEQVSNVIINSSLKKAFDFLPGFYMSVFEENKEEQKWEVFTDAYNNSYVYCYATKSLAYFKKTEVVFYFTAFEGDKNSLLYKFYIACYKIYLTTEVDVAAMDKFPLQLRKNNVFQWLQDVVAPFYIFSRLSFESKNITVSNDFLHPSFQINSKQILHFLNISKTINESSIIIENDSISSFSFSKNNKQINVLCKQRNYL